MKRIAALGLALAVLALAGAAFAGGATDIKPLPTKPSLPGRTFTLKVEMSRGVQGVPASGMLTLAAGAAVAYKYAPTRRAQAIIVKLDGAVVAASGTIVMNAHHKLEAFVKPVTMFRLKVMESYYQNDIPCYAGTGPCKHSGTPACGEFNYAAGTVVPYDLWQNWGHTGGAYLAAYPPAAACPPGLTNLGVMAPGEHITGSFVMDRDYTLVIGINIE